MPAIAAFAARVRAVQFGLQVAKTVLAMLVGFVLFLGGSSCFGGGAAVLIMREPGLATEAGLVQPAAFALGQPGVSVEALGKMGVDITALLQQAAASAPCPVSWALLGGVATVEDSSYGAKRAIGPPIPIPGGYMYAKGPAQFLDATWAIYGDGVPDDVFDPRYAYPALARYLCALRVESDPIRALWAYSGCVPGPGCARSDRYPFDVLANAAKFAAVVIAPASPLAEALLREAATWDGVPYVFGGCGRNGIDCSCFVQIVYRAVGVGLPRTTQLQYNATVGRGMGVATPAAGDLAFFRGTYYDPDQVITHVGIVSRVDPNGAVWMIHAPGARAAGDPPDMPFGRVREEVIAGFLAQHLSGFGRVLPSTALPSPA